MNFGSVEIFVMVVAGVLGYLAVSHFMEPKRGPEDQPKAEPPDER